MSFDKPTRNLLAKMTAAARDRLAEDITAQLQSTYGLYPDGARLEVAQTSEDRHAAEELRALLDHFENAEPEAKQRKANAYQRLVREIGFTLLNRIAALRLCEERGLIIECVRSGMNSAGFQLYDRLAGGALGNRFQTYRAFLSGMFDELAADLGALFDRRTPQSVVFPSEPALNDLLALLNDPELASRKIWQQDETIGWIYQYYNDPAERKKMRDESAAPRTSRELAVRNQFFTPRYVVEFLTDNTLGRTWYEMAQGQTKLTEQCRYLVRRPNEIFLGSAHVSYDEAADWVKTAMQGDLSSLPEHPEIIDIGYLALLFDGYSVAERFGYGDVHEFSRQWIGEKGATGILLPSTALELWLILFSYQRGVIREGWYGGEDDPHVIHIREIYTALRRILQNPLEGLSQEEMLQRPEFIAKREPKDPRRLRVLDPACGSGHFLLYAFDLLETIYSEAYADPDLGQDLQDAFPNQADFTREVPRLILENNLHGIDIDPRAAQIAALALWLRAQSAWQGQKLEAAERPQVGRTHIVVAEPMPGDEGMLSEFIADLPKDQHPEIIGPLVRTVFEKMKLAGEAGSLLKIEEELKEAIEQARTAWGRTPQPEQLSLLPRQPKPKQLGLDLTGVTDDSFWYQAEELVLQAMDSYSRQAENGKGLRRRLFAGDATQGFALIDLCRKRYDAILMNPPFGSSTINTAEYIARKYSETKNDIYATFVERAFLLLIKNAFVGSITGRNGFVHSALSSWRNMLIGNNSIYTIADLGLGVLDNAFVETAAYTVRAGLLKSHAMLFIDARKVENKKDFLAEAIAGLRANLRDINIFIHSANFFKSLPKSPFIYRATEHIRSLFINGERFEDNIGNVRLGLRTLDDFRYIRLRWEVPFKNIGWGKRWVILNKGGSYGRFYFDFHLLIDWANNGSVIKTMAQQKYGSVSRTIQAQSFYGKSGFTYPRRSLKGLSVRIFPAEGVFTDKGTSIFLNPGNDPYLWLGLFNGSLISAYVELQSGSSSFEVGYLQRLPANICDASLSSISNKVKKVVDEKQKIVSLDPTSSYFCLPWIHNTPENLQGISKQFEELNRLYLQDEKKVLGEIDTLVSKYLNFTNEDLSALDEILSQREKPVELPDSEDNEDQTDLNIQYDIEQIIDYMVGILYGRWDISYSLGEKEKVDTVDPFAPLPACSPGMLLNSEYLPVSQTECPDNYPIPIPWDSILADHSGLIGYSEPPEWDILRRLEWAFQVIWPKNHEIIIIEACQLLGIDNLREYFRKPSGFFAGHLKRYSKSRRQAPIYWPLSTPSGSFTLWIYYQRLTSETLYTAVNRFVSPKIEQVERYLSIFGRKCATSFRQRCASVFRQQCATLRADAKIKWLEFKVQ